MMMAGQCTPIFFLKHQKENGPHPQGVCRIRKRHSRQRLRNARSKEKMPGANLHMRVSLLKTRVFRICADWNRESSTGSRHSPAFEVHFPAGLVWRRLRWGFRTPFASLSAGAALVLAGRKIFGKFENDLRCGSFGTKFPDRIGAEGGNDRCGNIETLSQSDGGPF